MVDYFQTPIFLISYNRLAPLQALVQWLENAGYKNIHVIDNNSTFPPLLDYLARCPHQVHRLGKNFGHLALWQSGQFDEVIARQHFILSDCDVLPVEDCPVDVVERLAQVLNRYRLFTKVGLSLKIDDLPDCYALKEKVIKWESRYWQTPLENGTLFEAPLDTTFAYYRPGIGPDKPAWWRSLRTATPLTARHVSWYVDTTCPSEEDLYYQSHLEDKSSMWSVTDVQILKQENIRLHAQVDALKRELELQHNRPTYWLVILKRNVVAVIAWVRLRSLFRKLRSTLYRLF